VVTYAAAHACRRRQLLGYFGEAYAETNCGCCDVCTGQVARTEATREAQMILSAIVRTGERFGRGHITDIVMGAATERMFALGHDKLKTYGVGREHDKRHWRRVLDALLADGLIAMEGAEFPVLVLRPEAREVLSGQRAVYLTQEVKPLRRRKKKGAREEPVATGPAGELFERLRKLRYRLAQELGVPPYVIFTDRTLHEMARQRPATAAELLRVPGVGARKLTQFGPTFLALIQEHE